MAFDDAGLQTIWNSDVSYAAIVLKHPSVTAEPVTAFHVLRCPSKQELAKPQSRDKHIRLVYLAGLDLVPFDRITSIVNFDPFRGLEFPGGDGRRTVLRELFIKLLPEVGVGDERFRSLVSRPQELPLWPLAEPCVKLALHTAPGIRSFAYQRRQCTNRCGSFRATWTSH